MRIGEERMSHTPGPWHWDKQDSFEEPLASRDKHEYGWDDPGPNLISGDKKWVLSSWGHDAWGVTIREADASLIAAAPDLLEALKKSHACATLRDDGSCDGCFVSEAIAKAEGR